MLKPRYANAFFVSLLLSLLSRFGLAWILPSDPGFRIQHAGRPKRIRRRGSAFKPIQKPTHHSRAGTNTSPTMSLSSSVTATTDLPRLSAEHLQQLTEKQYVVIPNFLPTQLQDELRADVRTLRTATPHFKVARIGQDSTNQLNTDIRVAETCFLGPGKCTDRPNAARETL